MVPLERSRCDERRRSDRALLDEAVRVKVALAGVLGVADAAGVLVLHGGVVALLGLVLEVLGHDALAVRVGLDNGRVAVQEVDLLEREALGLRDKAAEKARRQHGALVREEEDERDEGNKREEEEEREEEESEEEESAEEMDRTHKKAKTVANTQQPPQMKKTLGPRPALPAPWSTRYGVE